MKLLSFSLEKGSQPRIGYLHDTFVVDIEKAAAWLVDNRNVSRTFLTIPLTMRHLLKEWATELEKVEDLVQMLSSEDFGDLTIDSSTIAVDEADVFFYPPVPDPPTFRDFYAFEQHVRAARKLRGLEMNPDWYRLPIFYFSNPTALYGHKDEIPYPRNSEEFDFELEFAVIVATGGRDIAASEADSLIAGYTILNDWSARDLQREEMPLSLGPAKGKDFANSFGPYLVTPDELADHWDDEGRLNLRMTCHVSGELISDGNTNDLYHSFPTMIERASMNVSLNPGDYIGSGTVGTGCILELRPENTGGWLKRGDVVRLEVEKLGVLENTVV